MTTRFRFQFVLFVAGVFVCGLNNASARQEADEKKFGERASVTVRVADAEGGPVAGVQVVPAGMVMANNSGVSYQWLDDQQELSANLVTDAKGEVALSYQKSPIEGTTVARILLAVKHPSFKKYSEWQSVGEEVLKVELKRGYQVAVTAVIASTGEPVKTDLYASTNRYDPVDWDLKNNGTLMSPVFENHERSFRLVQIVGGRALRFSELISFDPAGEGRHLVRDVKLMNATSIRGRLDEQVARPVNNGMAIAVVTSIRSRDIMEQHNAWNWTVCADIAEDGSFELDGLPADSLVQVAAICDGWVNQFSPDAEYDWRFPAYDKGQRDGWGLPWLVEPDDENKDLVLPMQPAGSCVVRVVDESDKPVANAKVLLHPFQLFFYFPNGPDFIRAMRSEALLPELRRIRGTDEKINYNLTSRSCLTASYESDENGLVTIGHYPVGGGSGHFSHPDFPPISRSTGNNFRFKLEGGTQTKLTLILKKTEEPK